MKIINQIEPLISKDDRNAVKKYIDSGGWITENKLSKTGLPFSSSGVPTAKKIISQLL